jgi:hypothetical protein
VTSKTISAAYPSGYYLNPTFTKLDIEGSANIGGPGVSTTAAHPSTVNNLGTVAGSLDGIVLSDGGRITNGSASDTAAVISGYSQYTIAGSAIVVEGAAGTVVNRATIMHPTGPSPYYVGYTVDLERGGMVTNGSAIDTTALISGGFGVHIHGFGTVINFGTISAVSYNHYQFTSVSLGDGAVINGAPSDTKATLIEGVELGTGTVTNFATIDGSILLSDGSVINGTSRDTHAIIEYGVQVVGEGTITNFGTIGTVQAVRFRSSSDRLIEEASGVLGGQVIGDGGTLELAAGMGAGTITGLGGTIGGFGLIEVDAGAGWRFTKSGVGTGTTLTNASAIIIAGQFGNGGSMILGALVQLATGGILNNGPSGQIDITGDTGIVTASGATGTAIFNQGIIEKTGGTGISNLGASVTNWGTIVDNSGVLKVEGPVSAQGRTGVWEIGGGVIEFRASVAVGETISFLSSGGQLELTDAAQFAAAVSGFAAGDALNLRSIAFGAATKLGYSGTNSAGTLTVSNGSNVAKIALLGQFAAANFAMSSDGQGGTDITFVAHPAPALAGPGR